MSGAWLEWLAGNGVVHAQQVLVSAHRRRQSRVQKMNATMLRLDGFSTREIGRWQGCSHQMAGIRSKEGAVYVFQILRSLESIRS